MVEYIVEGYSLDLGADTEIELTISVNDVRSPITTNNTWSKTVLLPATNNNNEAFNYIYDNNIEVGYNPNLRRNCEIRVDGVPVIIGYQKLDEINVVNKIPVSYSVIIYGSNTTIFSEMGDRLLTDLDFSEYDHTFSNSAITSTWEDTVREGYYYPWMNYNDKRWTMTELINSGSSYPFFPCIYAKTIVDKIFDEYGYTYDSNFFNSDIFKSLYIPFNNNQSYIDGLVEVTTTAAQIWDTDHGTFVYETLAEYDPSNIWLYNSGITTPATGTWTIHLTGQTDVSGTNYHCAHVTVAIGTRWIAPDGEYYSSEIYSNVFYNTGATDETFGYEINITTPEILEGRQLFATFLLWSSETTYTAKVINYFKFGFNTNQFVKNVSQVTAPSVLPIKLTQKDFFQNLILMFNLYIENNPSEYKRITIEPYSDYYARSTSTIDWTNKVDESSRKYKLMSEIGASSYNFSYTKDDDYLNKYYEDSTGIVPGEITTYIQNDFVDKEENVKLYSSPTIIERISGDENCIFPSVFENNTNVEETSASGYTGYITTNWNWRILSQNIITPSNSAFTYSGVTDFYTGSHICNYKGDYLTGSTSLWFDMMNTGYTWDYTNLTGMTTLYENYWKSYIDLIKNQNSKLLTMDVYLTETEIANLRFYERILIDDCYFYLNQLIYSPTSRQAKAELLLIPATELQEVYYENYSIYNIDNLYTGETFTASVDIHNFSQRSKDYNGSFIIKDTLGNVITTYPISGTTLKNSIITITQDMSIANAGNYIVYCTDGDKFNESVTVYVQNTHYTYSTPIMLPSEGIASGETSYISFTINALEADYTGITSGRIQTNLPGYYYYDWSFATSGITGTTLTIPFDTIYDINIYEFTGDIDTTLWRYVAEYRPSPPTTITPINVSHTGFTAKWNYSPSSNVIGYHLSVATDSGFTNHLAGYNDRHIGLNNQYAITGLTQNTDYYYRLRAYTSNDCFSSWSNITNIKTWLTPTLSVTPSSLYYDYMGMTCGTSSLTVTLANANQTWSLTEIDTGQGTTWFSENKTSGTGSTTVSVSFNYNPTAQRSAQLRFSSPNCSNVTITLTQTAVNKDCWEA